MAENNVYEKVSPGQSIRMIDVSSKTAQTLQYITKETSILKDCGTDYLSNVSSKMSYPALSEFVFVTVE